MIPEYDRITVISKMLGNVYVIIPVKNKEHYYWFLMKLVNILGITLASNQKSIIDRSLFDIDTFIREFFTEKDHPSDPKYVKLIEFKKELDK